jgi:hypothetical protein
MQNSGFGSLCPDCADDRRSDVTPHTQAHRHCLFCCQQHSTTYWSVWQRAKSTSRTSNQVRNKREYLIYCWFLSLLFEFDFLSRLLVLNCRLVCRDFSVVRRILPTAFHYDWSTLQSAASTSWTSNQVKNKREYRIFCWFLSLLFKLECLSRLLVLICRLVCRDFSAVRRISWP